MVQTHEYLVAPLVAQKPDKWQEELNRLAQQGWELSDVIALASGMWSLPGTRGPIEAVAFLKRPVAA
jgi:hypothetical protein